MSSGIHCPTFISKIHVTKQTNSLGGGALSLVALFVFALTIGAKPQDDNYVTVNNNYTRTLSVTLNYIPPAGQTNSVDPSTSPQFDIGSNSLQSITIWGQIVPVGTNATISDPIGGTAQVTWSGVGTQVIQSSITLTGG